MEKARSKSIKKNKEHIETNKARLEELYVSKLRPELLKKLNLSNIMLAPKVSKIVLNIGVKEAVSDSRVIQTVLQTMSAIAGQTPIKTVAKKSIAGFKIREGMPLGVCVTLRRKNMYEFLDKLINLALPKVRDFQGVPAKFDGRGNYNLGIKEWNIFPEAESNAEKTFGMNITIHTTAQTDAAGFELLKSFNMPFVKK